jgi:hypothetical protein
MTEASRLSGLHRDFFILRSSANAAFASWIGKLIVAQGKTYIDQSEHFGDEDFMNAMHKTFLSGARVVALYSQPYLDSKYCVREATEALKGDPANEQQRLIPLRIEPCAPVGMLNITYTDLLAERRQRMPLLLPRASAAPLTLVLPTWASSVVPIPVPRWGDLLRLAAGTIGTSARPRAASGSRVLGHRAGLLTRESCSDCRFSTRWSAIMLPTAGAPDTARSNSATIEAVGTQPLCLSQSTASLGALPG